MEYIKSVRNLVGNLPLILAGSMVIVMNEENKLLLQLRSDTNDWGVIGGIMELGESFEDTAKRELFEETGLSAEKFEIIGTLSGKDTHFIYPNGDDIHSASLIFKASGFSENLQKDEEGKELKFFNLEELSSLNLNPISRYILKIVGFLK